MFCDGTTETLEHFILECSAYNDVSIPSINLEKPYTENAQQIVSDFLFNEDAINENYL